MKGSKYMKNQIYEIIRKVLENDSITISEEMDIVNDLGMDSLMVMDMIIEIENFTNQIVKPEKVSELRTINDILVLVEELME